MAANSIGRAAARRADCKELPFKHDTSITKAHANRGFGVMITALADQFGQATVGLVATAGDRITGELCDVHDDGTCSVEVRDMILRTNNAAVVADAGDVLAGRGTTAGDVDVVVQADGEATVEGPIVYGGFAATDDGLTPAASVNFFRAQRFA